MHRKLVIYCFGALSVLAAGAIAEEPKWVVSKSIVETKILFHEDLADLEFELINDSNVDIALRKLEPSCACVEIRDSPKLIKANSNTKVRAQIRFQKGASVMKQYILVIDEFGNYRKVGLFVFRPDSFAVYPPIISIRSSKELDSKHFRLKSIDSLKFKYVEIQLNEKLIYMADVSGNDVSLDMKFLDNQVLRSTNILKFTCSFEEGIVVSKSIPFYAQLPREQP